MSEHELLWSVQDARIFLQKTHSVRSKSCTLHWKRALLKSSCGCKAPCDLEVGRKVEERWRGEAWIQEGRDKEKKMDVEKRKKKSLQWGGNYFLERAFWDANTFLARVRESTHAHTSLKSTCHLTCQQFTISPLTLNQLLERKARAMCNESERGAGGKVFQMHCGLCCWWFV